MAGSRMLAAGLAMGLVSVATAAELRGVVTQVTGLRVTVTDNQGRPVTLSVPAGTQLKAGDRVSLQTVPVGDTLRASAVQLTSR